MATSQQRPDHRIRQLVFDLTYADERDALAARTLMQGVFHEVIAPLLEELFDGIAPHGTIYRLDRLEIDLGRVNPERVDQALIRRAIMGQLGNVLASAPSPPAEETSAVLLQETLEHFLALGTLPWHAPFRLISEVEVAAMGLPAAQSLRMVRHLLPLLQQPAVHLRLVHQFTPRFLRWLVEAWRPTQGQTIVEVTERLLSMLPAVDRGVVLLAVLVELPAGESVTVATLEQQVRSALDKVRPQLLQNGVTLPLATSASTIELPVASRQPLRTGASQPPEAGFYVLHAGIVLLHPFLDRFFRRNGLLVEEVALATIEQRVRAVHLLYYLVTGQEMPEEHETPLLKLLCGLPLTFPLVKTLPLSQEERSEAAALLSATIEHWDKLKTTSPAALRETFLQREGKLIPREDRWRLVVEQQSFDVLLSYLPWTLSIVRLPWMASPLWVDWA